MLTDKFLEESGDDVSNDFSTLETLLLIWMGLRLRNLASLEDIEEEYPKWKNKACREFFEYSGTEFQKVKKNSQNKVKSIIKDGIALTISNIFSRLKDTDAQTSKKDMLNRSNKNLNKGIKDTQGEIKNLCNISRKCTNRQFIKACDEAYSRIVAGNNADKAIESSIRKLSQKGIEVVGYTDHTTSMDAAVKRAVTSGVNQTSLKFKMDNCKELFGYHSHETVEYLAMVGDTSDDIPGFPGIGPVKARKILDEGRIEKFIAQSKNKEYLQIWKRNEQLIDLFWFVRHNPLDKLPIKSKKKFKYEKFKELCIEYSLASFLTNEFIKPFKALHHE